MLQQGASNITGPINFLLAFRKYPGPFWTFLSDPEDKLNAFNLLFNNVLGEHAPIKTVKIRGRPNPYVTCEIRDLMRSRDQWKKVAQKKQIHMLGLYTGTFVGWSQNMK